jgi:pre-mRNA-splicing factor 38A
MANRTDPAAKSIRGTNPQNLVEKILRSKIYQNTYWKEQCFGLTAETLVDKAMELDHLGGTYGGNRKPTPFMCLVMKMLQIQPEKEIVIEFIKNDDYKYFLAPFISTNKIVSILIILFFLSNLIC